MLRSIARSVLLAVVLAPASLACGESSPASGAESAAGEKHKLVGDKAPAFVIETTSKSKVRMASLKGKVVVVDFWATWCEPCKKSFPKLQDLYTKYKASGLEVVAVSEDDDADGLSEFGAAYGAKFPLGWDKDKAIAGKWDPKSMPSTFIVDREGVVRFAHLGFHDGEEVELEKEIKSLL